MSPNGSSPLARGKPAGERIDELIQEKGWEKDRISWDLGDKGGKRYYLQPKWRWVDHIYWTAKEADTAVYFKDNMHVLPKELPFE